MKTRFLLAIIAACVSRTALADVCTVDVCNYGDPQYQAAYARYKPQADAWQKCVSQVTDRYFHALDNLAVLYPRFGIAYRAMQDEDKSAQDAETAKVTAASNAMRDAASAAFAAAEHVYVAAHPSATVLDIQAYVYSDPSYIAAAKAANDETTMENVSTAADQQESVAMQKAKQQFEDRILRTAEPEALEFYNLYQLKVRQGAQSCGPAPTIPEPPRK